MTAEEGAPAAGARGRMPLLVNWVAQAVDQLRFGAPYEQVVASLQAGSGDAARGVQLARAAYAAERYRAGATYPEVIADLTTRGSAPEEAEASALRGYTVFAAEELRQGRPITDMPTTGTWRIPAQNALVRYAWEELAGGMSYYEVVAAVSRMDVPIRDGTPRSIVYEEAQRVAMQAGDRAAGLRRELRDQQASETRRVAGMSSIVGGVLLLVGGTFATLLLSWFVAGGVIAIGGLVAGAILLVKGVAQLGIRGLLTNWRAAALVAVAVLALVAGVALVPMT